MAGIETSGLCPLGKRGMAYISVTSFSTVCPCLLFKLQENGYIVRIRGQDRVFREFLLPRRPPGEYDPRRYVINASLMRRSHSTMKLEDPLFEVIQMRVRSHVIILGYPTHVFISDRSRSSPLTQWIGYSLLCGILNSLDV